MILPLKVEAYNLGLIDTLLLNQAKVHVSDVVIPKFTF